MLRPGPAEAAEPRPSERSRHLVRRRAGQRRRVHTTCSGSRVALPPDPVRRAPYEAGRARRSVADRLLAVAGALWRTGPRFDPDQALAG